MPSPDAGKGRPAAASARASGISVQALSLVELLVAVAVIVIISSIAIPRISNLVPSASDATATRNLNYLNGAVQAYNQAVEELDTNASAGEIITVLQTRDAARHGSPYLPSNLKTNSTSDTSTYRAEWTNRMFKKDPPGTAGTGVDLLKMM